jgi:phage shock protein PspC (stress-responsive transcriptional regulator)
MIKLYRKPGWILGVCAGFADNFGLPLGLTRLGAFISLFFIPFFWLFYLIAGFSLPLKTDTTAIPQVNANTLKQTLNELERDLDGLTQRISELEDYVVSEHFDLQRRLGKWS